MCIVNLTPSGVVGTPNGRWFLKAAALAGGWAGSLDVSCDGISFVTISGLPSDTIPLNNACGDTTNIYVDLSPFTNGATFSFYFVSPDTEDASICLPSPPDCIDCALYHVSIEDEPADVVDSICTGDAPANLFDIAGLDCNDFDIAYQTVPPSPQDIDFELGGVCAGTKGDFDPANITPDTYVFEFTRKFALSGCNECVVLLTLTVTDPAEAGTSFADVVCI